MSLKRPATGGESAKGRFLFIGFIMEGIHVRRKAAGVIKYKRATAWHLCDSGGKTEYRENAEIKAFGDIGYRLTPQRQNQNIKKTN